MSVKNSEAAAVESGISLVQVFQNDDDDGGGPRWAKLTDGIGIVATYSYCSIGKCES